MERVLFTCIKYLYVFCLILFEHDVVISAAFGQTSSISSQIDHRCGTVRTPLIMPPMPRVLFSDGHSNLKPLLLWFVYPELSFGSAKRKAGNEVLLHRKKHDNRRNGCHQGSS